MEKKIWVTSLMYPAVYTDNSKTIIDFSKNKSNVIVDNYSKVFTNKNEMLAYVASHKNTAGILTVSEENANKYADELLEHLNAEKHRTVVKSYRVLVQPIPKEDIEKPGVNTPVTDGWYLPPKK